MNAAGLLLADASPCLRLLVLRELLARPADDEEVLELAPLRNDDPLARDLVALQDADGFWRAEEPDSAATAPIMATARALGRLGYLGFDREHPSIAHGAEWLFAHQQPDGSWPLPGMDLAPSPPSRNAGRASRPATAGEGRGERSPAEAEGYSMIPLQTALPLRGLAACGYAEDPRAERAYTWVLAQRLPDGAWPTGIASGTYGRVAGYRRLAHSRWGCRSNTTAALVCLALHPGRRQSAEARQGLDLLLGRETREEHALGFEVARLLGAERARGFLTYFALFDPGLALDLCWRIGATIEDERVSSLASFVRETRGRYGLWQYRARPQVSRWVSFDLLRSLTRLQPSGGWLSLEPRTPFRAYARQPRRY